MAYHGTPGHLRRWPGMSEWELAEKRAEVRRLLRCEDVTIAEIATRTGFSSRQVARIAKKMGLAPRYQRFTEEEKERIREMGRQGMSGTEILMRLRGRGGGGTRDIMRILDKAGIPRRHPGEIWSGDRHFGHVCKGNVKR